MNRKSSYSVLGGHNGYVHNLMVAGGGDLCRNSSMKSDDSQFNISEPDIKNVDPAPTMSYAQFYNQKFYTYDRNIPKRIIH